MTATLTHQAFRYLRENPDNPHRLGRHQVHDVLDAMPERQLEHAVDLLKPLKTIRHAEHVGVFDQGQLGSCTANAAYGVRVTGTAEAFSAFQTLFKSFCGRDVPTEDDCVALYELETKIDDSQVPGEYPPDDTGSSGPWSMMAMEKDGLVAKFLHTRSVRTALGALNTAPISIGIPWLQSMFTVDRKGFIEVDAASGIAGGHQIAVVGQDVDKEFVTIRNSWGDSWGDEGHANLRWSDLRNLFAQGGDAVQPAAA